MGKLSNQVNPWGGAMEHFDGEEMAFWFSLIATGISIIGTIVGVSIWLNSRSYVTRIHIDEVANRCNELHNRSIQRIVALETDHHHYINEKKLNEALMPLYNLVRNEEQNHAALNAQLQALNAQLTMLTNLLMERGLNGTR